MPVYENPDPGIKSMKGLHVYHYFLSNCAQRVSIAFEEKGQDWTPHAVNLFTQENTRDEYFRINPTGLVPALVHDVFPQSSHRGGRLPEIPEYP